MIKAGDRARACGGVEGWNEMKKVNQSVWNAPSTTNKYQTKKTDRSPCSRGVGVANPASARDTMAEGRRAGCSDSDDGETPTERYYRAPIHACAAKARPLYSSLAGATAASSSYFCADAACTFLPAFLSATSWSGSIQVPSRRSPAEQRTEEEHRSTKQRRNQHRVERVAIRGRMEVLGRGSEGGSAAPCAAPILLCPSPAR